MAIWGGKQFITAVKTSVRKWGGGGGNCGSGYTIFPLQTNLKIISVGLSLNDLSYCITFQLIIGNDGLHCSDGRVSHLVKFSLHFKVLCIHTCNRCQGGGGGRNGAKITDCKIAILNGA